jgi:antirestriction protein ArdC
MNATARPQIDELLGNLRTELATPGTSLLPLLTTMSRFSRYSLANQMLIYAQCPAASHVLGFRSWLKAGYQVRKGERGIAIYAPMHFARHDAAGERDDAADALLQAVTRQGQPSTSSQGRGSGVPADGASAGKISPRLGFRVAYVFDLSQVDPLPGTDTTAFATHFADACAAELAIHRLHAFLVGHNVELEYRHLAPGLMGYTNGRRITCSLGQPAPVEFATLAHETTHLLLHFPADRGTRPDRVTRETEAEAVAYLLCAQLGLAGTEASVEYIKSYRGTPDTLDASLERIRATAQRLAGELARISFDADPAVHTAPPGQSL